MAELAELSTSKTQWRGGRLLHIHIAPAASVKMEELAEANFVAGRGIEGDRYFLGTGTYSAKPDFREVTVFEMEVLEALARNDPPVQSGPIKIEPNHHRRNLTVRGVPLNHLVGQRFRVGSAVLFGGDLISPASISRSFSACRSICHCITDQASIAGSRKAAPSAAAIRSNRLTIARPSAIARKIELNSPKPNMAKAKSYSGRALTDARQKRAKSCELRAAMSMARLWRDQGKRDEARELLAPV